MTTNRTHSLRKAILATVAVAGLVAGTAACGGKNSDTSAATEKQELIELLLDAARQGSSTDQIADIIAQADPNLIAQVLPEIDGELDITFPEMGIPDSVASEAVTPEETAPDAPESEVSPEEVAPEIVTPEEEIAPEAVTPEEDVAPETEDEVAPESGSGGGFTFPGVSLPPLMNLTVTPQVEGVMFWITGDTTKVTVMVNEKSPLALADIVEVKVTYRFLGMPIVDYGVKGGEVGTNVWSWIISDTVIDNDTDVTITVTNAAGKVHTYTTTATLSAPL